MLPLDLFWLGGPSSLLSAPVRQNVHPISRRYGIDIESYPNHMFRVTHGTKGIPGQEIDFVKKSNAETVVIGFDNATGTLTLRQLTDRDLQIERMGEAIQLCGPEHKDGFAECVADQMFQEIDKFETQFKERKELQISMANRLRNYTCSDPDMPTSTPIHTESIFLDRKEIVVDTFLDTKNAKIFAVNNFVSNAECDVLRRHGEPRLQRATVAAIDGSSVISENRKAQQASYDIHLTKGPSDPLWLYFLLF